MTNIRQGRSSVSGSTGREELDRFTNHHQEKITNNPDAAIREHAQQQGMKVDGVKEQLQERGVNLAKKHKNLENENATQYNAIKKFNENEAIIAKQQVEKHEKNRIGKGVTGTLGHLVNGVGKPDDKK